MKPAEVAVRDTVEAAAKVGDAILPGAVRQEISNGLTPEARFVMLRDLLRTFRDQRVLSTDCERAAQMFTHCKARGIHGSDVDFLICAVAERLDASILTMDGDFGLYATVLPIRLHTPQ